MASRYDREVVGLTTVVSVANAYFQVLAAQDRLRVANENLTSATRILNLINQRAQAGTASALEIAQQESLVNQVKAAIPPLEQTLHTNRTALAVADRPLARAGARRAAARCTAIAIPRVTPGLPSELLTQRPDIREAEANLAAANANVYNARAQFLPSITLTGDGGYESAVLRVLMRPESVVFSVAAGLTQPIFEGGRLLGNVDLQTARQDELLQDYRKAVISAFVRRRERALQRAPDGPDRAAARRGGRRVRGARSMFPNSGCVKAPSTSSPCCKRNRRCLPQKTRWRRRSSRACRRSSVFIRRLGVAGYRNRWKLRMHGELPKRLKQAASRRRIMVTGLVVVAVAAALAYVFARPVPAPKTFNRFAAEGPVPILAATVGRADVPVYLDAVGTVKAYNTVTISPQVDGKILSVNFNEGQDVKKGDVLARIDPAIYQAQLDQAVAKKAQDEAQLANAKRDLERYVKLAATNAINKQQADTQAALVAQDTAIVQADQAAIENAQTLLNYTTITAPIDGRTGVRQVDEGNIVHAAASPAIVVITQLKPITVIFNLPQQELDRVNAAFAKGALAVDALRSDSNEVIEPGKLTVIDNQVDSTTGTVKLKAEFANADLSLWPGQFVNVQLLIDTLQNVVVIPTGAVQRGPTGTFVYVINADNTAAIRQIAVQKQDETQTVVKSGLEPNERVVTTGFARLTDGAKVTVSSGAPAPGPRPPGVTGVRPRRGEQQRGEAGGGARPTAPQ